jgi:hypothetical protein
MPKKIIHPKKAKLVYSEVVQFGAAELARDSMAKHLRIPVSSIKIVPIYKLRIKNKR